MEFDNIYQGDCLELIKQLEDNSIDLILTDPPFCIDYNKKTKSIKRKQKQINLSYSWDKINNLKDYREFIKRCLKELYRVLKEDSSLYMWCADNSLSYFRDFLEEIGFKFKATIIWHKTNPAPQFRKVNFISSVEYLIYAIKGKPTFNFKFQNQMHNFIQTPICMGKERAGIHESQKPLSVLKPFIEISTKEGDSVLDIFNGSGSTTLAAAQLNRKYIGFEINAEYVKLAKERLSQIKLNMGVGKELVSIPPNPE